MFISCFQLSYSQDVIDPDLFSPKGVAAVYINLEEDKKIEDINKVDKLIARMRIVNANNSTYSDEELYDGLIKIKGRGNTTWTKFPKKPYSIDLIDEEGEDNPSSLLGMPEDEEWALITNYTDKSMLRMGLAYNLGTLIGMEYSPRLHFVEVYLNNEYIGVYYLCEKIKRGKNRVNVKKLDKKSSEEDISGGYIIEVTPQGRFDPTDSTFVSSISRLGFTIKYPKAKNISKEQVKWINNYVNKIDTALYIKGDEYTEDQFKKHIDENSLIDWFLINELAKNNDAGMYASVFFFKDRNSKLKAGPLWDFDIAFGNVYYGTAAFEDNFQVAGAAWFRNFFIDEEFVKKTRARYEELKPLFDRIPEIIEKNAQQLSNTGAVDRNFERWPILGEYVWPNVDPYPKTYDGELQRLSDWIKARNSWLNVNLCLSEEKKCEVLSTEKIPLRPYDTDKFHEGDTTIIRAVKGYDTYVWNDTIVSDSYELDIMEGGKYWVSVKKGESCFSTESDTLIYVAKAKITYLDDNWVFRYDGTPKTKKITTIPEGLKYKTIFIKEENGEDVPLVEIIDPGVYRMKTVIDEEYYKGEDIAEIIILTLTDIDGLLKDNLSVTINNKIIYIKTEILEKGIVTVSDITGKIVYSGEMVENLHTIDMKGYLNGVYLLTFESSGGKNTVKVIIK